MPPDSSLPRSRETLGPELETRLVKLWRSFPTVTYLAATNRVPLRAKRAYGACARRFSMTRFRRIKPLGLALVIAVGVVGAGCDDKSSAPAGGSASAHAASSASAAPKAAPSASAAAETVEDGKKIAEENDELNLELESHRRHHHAGFAGLVMDSIETVGTTPEQDTAIDKIKVDFRKKTKPVRDADKVVIDLLADGVAAGKIDHAKVEAAVVKATAAATAAHAANDELLDAVHKELRPEQRAALVDKIDAQWTVWKEANAGKQADDNAKPDGHLTHMAKDLMLTPDQVTKIKANLMTSEEKKSFDSTAADAHFKEFSAAFGAEGFDAKKLAAATAEGPALVKWGADRMAKFYEAITPVLTPDQRTKVAEKLRKRAVDPSK
jgi:Spy/CpxP family protein refolding chaperone